MECRSKRAPQNAPDVAVINRHAQHLNDEAKDVSAFTQEKWVTPQQATHPRIRDVRRHK